MASKSSKKSAKKAGGSQRGGKDYPNIIEEPIRVIGDDDQKSKQRKSQGQSRKQAVKKKHS